MSGGLFGPTLRPAPAARLLDGGYPPPRPARPSEGCCTRCRSMLTSGLWSGPPDVYPDGFDRPFCSAECREPTPGLFARGPALGGM